ncbi:hypothetical protein [Bacillus paramycoides]|uniref:hypothetical protein n=1 Tax=Bacillus paramycoides TaxID=2026194 RepID=UPI002E1DAEB6|nr:hypothetical protein [Bacillus paramycoides]
MTTYYVKLVDHTISTENSIITGICNEFQDILNKCMEGSNDDVQVSWGTGADSDNVVLHFVDDVDHSYLKQQFNLPDFNKDIAGHTHWSGSMRKVGSEFYKFFGLPRRTGSNQEYAKYAGHELIHNLYPAWTDVDMHDRDGTGLACGNFIPPNRCGATLPVTDKNKATVQNGFSVTNSYTQLL